MIRSCIPVTRYGGDPTKEAIQSIIDFRDKVNLPMYMGEIGHNTDEWQAAFCQTMREKNWANIVYFSERDRIFIVTVTVLAACPGSGR